MLSKVKLILIIIIIFFSNSSFSQNVKHYSQWFTSTFFSEIINKKIDNFVTIEAQSSFVKPEDKVSIMHFLSESFTSTAIQFLTAF